MADEKAVSLRKRQQIENTSKTMFMWVAIAAAVVAIAAVLSYSLVQRLSFNQAVLNKKGETVSNLRNNNEVAEELRASIREKNTNQALLDTPRGDGAEPLAVVLDALPDRPNTSALGASLQQKLLKIDGVTLESLPIDAAGGEADQDATTTTDSTETGENTIPFAFEVSSSDIGKIKEVLRNLERSIRVFNPQVVSMQWSEGKISLNVKGVVYYSPEVKVELKDELVPSKSKSSRTSTTSSTTNSRGSN